MNQRVDIREDIKQHQNTSDYTSSKVDYSMGLGIYMLPSDMKLNIRLRTVGYNNKSLVSDSRFSLGKNDMVNTSVPIHRTPISHAPKKSSHMAPSLPKPKSVHTSVSKHEKERIAMVLALACALRIWYAFH